MENPTSVDNKEVQIVKYEAPTIIYEGDISTRAGSPIVTDAPLPVDSGVDLFGD